MSYSFSAHIGLATFLSISIPASAATLTLQGNGLSTLFDSTNVRLVDTSIVQVGYFLGVDSNLSPEDFTELNWASFTPLTGDGSPNPRVDIRTRTQGAFTSVYSLGTVTLDDAGGDTIPPFPIRFGVRIFDTTDPAGLATADYNTTSSSVDGWKDTGVVTNPPTPNPNLGFAQGGTGANPALFWQDSANPFLTSITVIPEPSTSLSVLLGLSLLTGARRRN